MKESKKPEKLPELLAPAGSFRALEAAVESGADAVYFGMHGFNARAGAANFSKEETARAVELAHSAGVRVNITLNTLIFDRETDGFIKSAADAAEAGADALIVADPGGASLLKKVLPGLPLHASTQMSVHSSEGGLFWAERGFSRVVLAREMPLREIRSFVGRTGIETEIFIHGALCVCHSGQCLMSSMVGGRSGNRGECAQPCRLPYETPKGRSYPLSLKDLCLAGYVPELIDSGVSSLKIEGRMKPPSYVSAVVSVWRRLLDEGRAATPEELAYLERVFSRSGFTSDYFDDSKTPGHRMLGVRTEEDKKLSAAASTAFRTKAPVREPIPKPVYDYNPDAAGTAEKRHVKEKPRRYALFYDPRTIPSSASDYFDLIFVPAEKIGSLPADSPVNGVALPPVVFDGEEEKIAGMLKEAYGRGVRHCLVSNAGHLKLAQSAGLIPHGHFRLNVTNRRSAELMLNAGFTDLVPSPELVLPRLRDLGSGCIPIVYGRIPLMITEKCVGLECGTCRDCEAGNSRLRDRIGKVFPVRRVFEHRSEIFNCVPVYMADKAAQLREYGINSGFFIFSVETRREADQIIKAYKEGLPCPFGNDIRRIPLKPLEGGRNRDK